MKREGWIEHDGKGQPVSDETSVQIICRGDLDAEHVDRWEPAGIWYWLHADAPRDSDIVLYKLKS